MPYRLWIKDEAKAEIRQLPGHIRQRVRQAVRALCDAPRPHTSRPLHIELDLKVEPRRIRLDRWRIIYVIDEQWSEVGILFSALTTHQCLSDPTPKGAIASVTIHSARPLG